MKPNTIEIEDFPKKHIEKQDPVCISIEESAEEHADSYYQKESERSSVILEMDEWENRKYNFIEGAKSQAAKEYWYEQFKQNHKL